jgi:hypothetical protein
MGYRNPAPPPQGTRRETNSAKLNTKRKKEKQKIRRN